jgi:hypothetical protein
MSNCQNGNLVGCRIHDIVDNMAVATRHEFAHAFDGLDAPDMGALRSAIAEIPRWPHERAVPLEDFQL